MHGLGGNGDTLLAVGSSGRLFKVYRTRTGTGEGLPIALATGAGASSEI